MNIPLMEWKSKYGRVFKVRLEGKEIYFRLLSVEEIEYYKKDVTQLGKFLNTIILNNESLSSTGAKYQLSDFVIKSSFPESDESLEEKILHHRYKIKDNFLFNIISKLCGTFISYTPDDLKAKSFDQLLELVSIAELMTGKQLLGKKNANKSKRTVSERDNNKFEKPAVDELMEESTQALQAVMTTFGKNVPKLDDVLAKKNTPAAPLTDMQRQMKELNKIV